MQNRTTRFTFDSRIINRGPFPCDFSQEVIKNEPMFFNSDLAYAHEQGGPITKAFIEALPRDWTDQPVILDSRVHMLMPKWFPCIPGFHHDDVPRYPGPKGQPNYENPAYRSEHILGLVNGDIAPTRFALVPDDTHGERAPFTLPSPDRTIYAVWHDEVMKQLDNGDLIPFEAPSGQLLQFDWQTWHEGQRARASGWRWFVRVSRNTTRTATPSNEIRRQVQVYLENPMQGW